MHAATLCSGNAAACRCCGGNDGRRLRWEAELRLWSSLATAAPFNLERHGSMQIISIAQVETYGQYQSMQLFCCSTKGTLLNEKLLLPSLVFAATNDYFILLLAHAQYCAIPTIHTCDFLQIYIRFAFVNIIILTYFFKRHKFLSHL